MNTNSILLLVPFCLVLAGSALSQDAPAASSPNPAAEVSPPFGLKWGDAQERVERLLTNARAKIVERKQEGPELVLYVESLAAAQVKRTLFAFRDDQLKRVVLQQAQALADAEQDAAWQKIKERITAKCGAGEELTPVPGTTATRETVWKKPTSRIVLRSISADEGEPKTARRLEVSYESD